MTLPVSSGVWTIDPMATKVGFTVKNMIFKTVPGTFAVTSGSASVGADVGDTTISATVDASSFDTGHAKRDEHVRSADFFDAATHPTISFESTAVRNVASGYEVDGTIRAKGNTAPVTFKVDEVRAAGDAVTFTATAKVERAALGAGKMPNLMISKTALVTVTGRATRS